MSNTLKTSEKSTLQVLQPQQAGVLRAFGDKVQIVLPAALTRDAISVAAVEVAPHAGPPPHVHRCEDEAFLIEAGRFEFWLDGDSIEVGAGDIVYGPRDVPHTFRNLSDEPAKMCVLSVSAGFESFFCECARIWGAPDAMAQVTEIAARHRIEFVDPKAPRVGAPANGKTPRVVRAGAGENLALPEGSGHICLSESDTAGEFALGIMEIPSLSGPPAHVHHQEDEIILVQSGAFEFCSNGQRHRADAGDVVWIPREVAHSFRCVSAEAGQIAIIFAPGGVAAYFRQLSALLTEGQLNPDKLRAMSARYGLELLPSA